MQFLRDLIHNSMLVAPVTAWVVAQLLKAIYGRIKSGKFAAERLVGPGGMPRSHAAMTTALVVMVGRVESVASPVFAIAVVLTAIVMYDAMGVRWHAGQQAKVINRLSELLQKENGLQLAQEKLKEVLGHRPFEVLMGAVLGLIIGFVIPASY